MTQTVPFISKLAGHIQASKKGVRVGNAMCKPNPASSSAPWTRQESLGAT